MKQKMKLTASLRRRLQDGEENAWRDFFAEFDPVITSVVAWPKWRFLPDVRDDISQIIRREIVKALPRFEARSNLNTFIKRICVNRCIDEVRRQVRERAVMVQSRARDAETDPPEPEARAGDEFDPVSAIMKMERAAGLRLALEALDETCRSAVKDFYSRDLSYKEMAQIHGITVNTVGSRLAKCLQKLRKTLESNPNYKDLTP